MEIDGGAIGAIAVGFVIAQVTFKPTVDTTVGNGAVVRGSSVSVTANNTSTGNLLGVAAGGGILSGQGLDIEMEIDPTTSILVDQDATLTATDPNAGFVNITSTANTTSDATGNAGNYGGILVIGGATSTLNNVNTVTIGSDAVISAGTSVTVLATSTNDAESSGNAGSDGVVPIIQASTTTNESDETHTTISTGASLTSGTDMSVEARTSSTGKSTPTSTAGGLGVNTESDLWRQHDHRNPVVRHPDGRRQSQCTGAGHHP
jgi:hypothetical protein